MRLYKSLSLIASLFATVALAQGSIAAPKHEMARETEKTVIKILEKPLAPGKVGPAILTDGSTETPDPTRPIPVTLPNGQKKYLVGLSGQHVVLVDHLTDLASGQKQLVEVDLYNENGHQYGGEIDPITHDPIGYALDSSTWDITVVHAKNEHDDGTHMVILAGAMGNDENGKPLLISEGMTSRRRVFFHNVKFEDDSKGAYKLVARAPTSPLTKIQPPKNEWVVKDKKGNFLFNHGYGGEPVMLPNGDLYIDERGWVPVIHESVIEQRMLPNSKGNVRMVPFHTVLAVTYMDPTLTKVMQPAKSILDVYKPDGSVWAAARRPHIGPLVEGAHIEVQFKGQTLKSMPAVEAIRKAGGKLEFEMMFSAGEYYAHYGSFIARASGLPETFKPVVNKHNELLDITEPLKVLFVGAGRPALYTDENGQKNLLMHGAARSDFPETMELNVPIQNNADWKYFQRRLLNVPVELVSYNGVSALRPVDNSGLIRKLTKYTPREQKQPKPKADLPALPGRTHRRAVTCELLFKGA